MRIFVTFILIALSIIAVGIMRIQLKDNNLSRIFGRPPIEKNERIYTFNPIETKTITVQQANQADIRLRRENGIWQVTAPYQDRADPRLAGLLLAYSRNLIVEEVIKHSDIEDTAPFSIGKKAPQLTLKDQNGNLQSTFTIGAESPWTIYNEEEKGHTPTTYIAPKEKDLSKNFYLCAGNVSEVFEEGSQKIRDHRPFFFDPQAVGQININLRGVTVTLEKTLSQKRWGIVKPIELKTDPIAIKKLIDGLTQLTASDVADKGEGSLLFEENDKNRLQISLFPHRNNNSSPPPSPVTLDISLPNSQENTLCSAEISNRPHSRFSIPLESLVDLPVTINQLRDRSLTGFRVADLQMIEARSLAAPPTLIHLIKNNSTGDFRWMTGYGDDIQLANEQSVANLFEAITTDKAINIVSDNVNTLEPYGLNRPQKTIRLLHKDRSVKATLNLSQKENRYYAQLEGSRSVLEIDALTYHKVFIYPHEWKDSLLWHFPIIDLEHLVIQSRDQASLILDYDYLTENWKALKQGQDVTPHLNQNRANKFLTFLEGARVEKWLPSSDPLASLALENPVYKLAARFRASEVKPAHTLTFQLARASKSSQNTRYYIRTNATRYIGIVELPFAERLAVDLFNK